MPSPPARGTIVSTTPRPEAGMTEWTLSNGATIVLKPTKLKEDQILFRASASGGTSLASDADFLSARVSGAIVPAGGVGQFSQVTLDKLLSGKAVAVAPFIGEITQGMRGGSTPQDLETMFQLLYLRFTQPRADPASFAAMRLEAKALVANQDSSPDVVFDHAIDAALSSNNARRQPESTASVDQWNRQTDCPSTKPVSPTPATSRLCSSAASTSRRSSRWLKPTSPRFQRPTRTSARAIWA